MAGTGEPQVLVVTQPFKESLTAAQVATAISRGVKHAGRHADVVLGSDGGDGLLEALGEQLVGADVVEVPGPLGEPARAAIGWLDRESTVIESRQACGLGLVPADRRNPLVTKTDGVGALLCEAIARGARRIFVGLGGSATMDGGLGFARALGWVARDRDGDVLVDGGKDLARVHTVDAVPFPAAEVVGLCDVRNVLLGADGARVYAGQKGADPSAEEQLARGLERLVRCSGSHAAMCARMMGAGAAGGLGFGLAFFAGGRLVQGAPWVLDRVGLDARLRRATCVIIAEARFDRTSLAGKLAGEVIQRCQAARIPLLLLAPEAAHVPPGVTVESGGGWWNAADLTERTQRGLRRLRH